MQRARPVAVETGPVTLRSNATSIHGPAVINVDETGTVTAANQEAAELTGYDVSELIGLGVEQL
ncbi:MAG: PAS domain S-box protein, partial [Chloroflexi bacterium]|nr:PAS domain S-box protein [Chloroflexota bacterium]